MWGENIRMRINKRHLIFLKDVFFLALSTFGGPQAHMAMLFKVLVHKRKYISEDELLELNALCQILPGPTSTQTITAIGFRMGGANLAYLTLLVWCFPAVSIMTVAAICVPFLDMNITRFIQPMAIGFVAYAAYMISSKVVVSKTGVTLMVIASFISYIWGTPWILPIILLGGGVTTAFKFRQQPKEEKVPMNIDWANFFLFVGVFFAAALIGAITHSLYMRVFENFYRNGSLIFGGGQVLIPLMYTEFVEFKKYLSSSEFLSGYALAQAVPGPVFSFCSYIGALTFREDGIMGQVLGAFLSAAGIFLPGTFLIFFAIRFWTSLKRYRVVKASLEGINAVSSGLVISSAISMFYQIPALPINFIVLFITLLLLLLDVIPPPFIILGGLLAGLIF
jgi:chromate transporter